MSEQNVVAHEPHPEGHTVTFEVNGKSVQMQGPRVTAGEIKAAAIAQGVAIQMDFVLSEEKPHGGSKILGDADVVTVNKNSRFVAVAPDDNS